MDPERPSDGRFAGRRVLITGGLGFIGSNLALRLVDLGARVTLIDNLLPQYGGNRFNVAGAEERLTVHVADVRDPGIMESLIAGAEVLFNLAGQTSHMDSMSDPQTDLAMNCAAQLTILEASRRFNPAVRIVFASTRQVYGRPLYLPVDEAHPANVVDINGVHKLAAESYHRLYSEIHGLSTCSLRLTNVIGPRMRIKDDRQTFVGSWIRAVVEGTPFEVWGGSQVRDLIYVDDAVEAFLKAASQAELNGQCFNIGDTRKVSLLELAEAIVAANGSGDFHVRDFPEARRAIDIGDFFSDASKARAELGWQARTPLVDALTMTLAYYRRHSSHYV